MVSKNCVRAAGFVALATGLSLMLAGCASPGAPLPPSLKLPQVPTDLTATRVGTRVVLRWTTSARTTDRALVTGPVTAEACRETLGAAGQAAGTAPRQGRRSSRVCNNVVARAAVSPGASELSDPLPAPLTAGAPVVLAYRVQLLNAAGKTAGASQVVYAAAGAAPEPVTGLKGSSTKPGVVLEWTHATGAGPADSVELDRMMEPSADNDKPTKKEVALLGGDTQAESRFSARDTGGAIDRTAKAGEKYRYTVQRVRAVPFQGKTLEIRSEATAPVEVAVKTVFPPDMPTGLIAAPAFSELGKPAIDLSWEPNVEVRIAGYKVYRRTGAEPWRVLTPDPVTVAAYRDVAVTPGERYTYRVTAVNDAGMESEPSAEVQQSAAER